MLMMMVQVNIWMAKKSLKLLKKFMKILLIIV